MTKRKVKEICCRSHCKLSGNIKIRRFEQELVILLQNVRCHTIYMYSQPCLNGTSCVGTNHKLERNAVHRSGGHIILEHRSNFETWNEGWAKFHYENVCNKAKNRYVSGSNSY